MIDTNELREALTRHGVRILNEDEVLEILDRLEEAESARRDDYQNWMTALDRNAELLAKLEAAEKERDVLRDRLALESQENGALRDSVDRACEERDALRAALRHEADCVEATKAEIVTLRTKIEQMEKQEPYCWTTSPPAGHYSRFNPEVDRWIENGWTVVPLYLAPGAQPAPSLASGDVSLISEGKTRPAPSVPECPYPCGWRSLLKLAIEDGAYLARSINEDEPVTENARAVTMRTVMRLRDVLMAINNAAPGAKP